MKIQSKRIFNLMKVFFEQDLETLNSEHDSLFDLPEDPAEKIKENNLNIAAAERTLSAVNYELSKF